MKTSKKIKNIFCILLTICVCSCNYLDVVPDDVATIDHAFRDKNGAEAYLATCYVFLPSLGDPRDDPAITGSIDTWSFFTTTWPSPAMGDYRCFNIKISQNASDPEVNFWEGRNRGRALFRGIRECNIFLANINNVGPDLNETQRKRMIAEVTFLKAYFHYYLLKAYGPIPLVKESLPVSAGISESRVYRDKFDDCIDYIIELIDAAFDDLPLVIHDQSSELRRITQPIAAAVKAQVLVTAASPLFNNNPDYAEFKDNRGVYLFESELTPLQKWERARDACKEAIEVVEQSAAMGWTYGLYDFSYSPFYPNYSNISDTSKMIMTLRTVFTDRWNREVIWGTLHTGGNGGYFSGTMPFFMTSHVNLNRTQSIIGPTMNFAELFYSKNGVPIEEDRFYEYDSRFTTDVVPEGGYHRYLIEAGHITAKANMNRELRFYANLGFDGAYWLGNGRTVDFDMEPEAQRAWVTRMMRGQASGNADGLRFSITGYLLKKAPHIQIQVNTAGNLDPYTTTFPIIRLADLYLLYAEALNECLPDENAMPTNEIYHYVNLIRTRAGLDGVVESWRDYSSIADKPSTKRGMREIIQRERTIELAFEGKYFWDIRRWKTATDVMNQPVRGWNTSGEVPDDYYNLITIHQCQFFTRDYLWPIRQTELFRNTNLVQNPGWEFN